MNKHLEVWFQLHLDKKKKKKFDTDFKPNKLGNHRVGNTKQGRRGGRPWLLGHPQTLRAAPKAALPGLTPPQAPGRCGPGSRLNPGPAVFSFPAQAFFLQEAFLAFPSADPSVSALLYPRSAGDSLRTGKDSAAASSFLSVNSHPLTEHSQVENAAVSRPGLLMKLITFLSPPSALRSHTCRSLLQGPSCSESSWIAPGQTEGECWRESEAAA